MNKLQFTTILQCSLLAFDNVSQEEMGKFGLERKYVKIGIKLCEYLKDIKMETKQ